MEGLLKIRNKDIKVVIQNFTSLSVLQLINNLLPIATMPYLVRILGPNRYGLIAYAQAIMQYFANFTDYGFNLTATKDISICRDDNSKVNQIFNAVMLIKLVFMIISFIVLCLLIFLIPALRKEYIVYLLTFGMVVGNVIFPTWFFQGVEYMSYITIINAITKILFTIGVFVFVKRAEDYLIVPLLYTLGFIVSGIIALRIIARKFHVRIEIPDYDIIAMQLKKGWNVFISTLMISFNFNSPTILLGMVTNNTIVGYYSAGEKLIRAIQRMLYPIQQATFPYASRITGKEKTDGVKFLRKLTIIIGSFTLIMSLSLLAFSGIINYLLFGPEFSSSIEVFRILCFIIFFNTIGNIFGIQTMIVFNYEKQLTRIMILSSIINIVLSIVLSIYYKHIGCAWAVLITELFICVSTFIFINRKGIKVLRG